ncbi:hypothetical protein QUF81_00090 [Peribacillus simplex]|uniref:hypothetical protein n=1 Tax=Peribacillus simplex TaxID=1478 RepID=UPI0025A2639D|nr:hypothetical protein [Peribacillus simplex]MDM5291702.1 hypothetical protein [Peribacillus simplex]
MIKIKQGVIPSELDLSNPSSAASKENEKAKAYFSPGPKPEKDFKFNAYRCSSLRKVLNKSFNGKCAYCESYIIHISAMEIEHYRPKKAIKIKNKLVYPGYYWLAAEFLNLLPACPACNQLRKYELEDGTCITSGKGNNFPIECESKRASMPGDEIHEHPLLLHPYHDKPHKHLTFLKTGLVHHLSKKGLHSMEVYALKRPELVPQRKAVIRGVQADIRDIIDAIESIQEAKSVRQLRRHKSSYNRHYSSLRKRMCSKSPFAAVARNILHKDKVLKDLRKLFKEELRKAIERIYFPIGT